MILTALTLVLGLRLLVVQGYRGQDQQVLARLKSFNRRWFNPWILRIAGRGWGYAARLEHRGRVSGRLYATPVIADPIPRGFLIPLPYGLDVDWAQNLLHTGVGRLQHRGVLYQIGRPYVVPAAAAVPELPWLTQRIARLYAIRHFLQVEILPDSSSAMEPPPYTLPTSR